jgi:hypothetical protein
MFLHYDRVPYIRIPSYKNMKPKSQGYSYTEVLLSHSQPKQHYYFHHITLLISNTKLIFKPPLYITQLALENPLTKAIHQNRIQRGVPLLHQNLNHGLTKENVDVLSMRTPTRTAATAATTLIFHLPPPIPPHRNSTNPDHTLQDSASRPRRSF